MLVFASFLAGLWTEAAEVFVRYNEAGYRPEREIRLLVMAGEDLAGERWTLGRETELLVVGRFRESLMGRGPNTPMPYNYAVDLPAGLAGEGRYVFATGGVRAEVEVRRDPYQRFLQLPLLHLRRMRSGPEVPPPRRASHLGDGTAPVWVPDGDPAEGQWKPDPSGRVVDMVGGWYDAGDQLKFTLNIAYTTYHLLLAYDLQPSLFEGRRGPSGDPLLIEEATHGLEWLMKTHPAPGLFVIQVGDERDHHQPPRLPEDDALDGHRPALCALSRVHMASASAALAMGARIWEMRGDHQGAARYEAMAARLFDRLHRPDTVPTAFERGKVNDFYKDEVPDDQIGLAAAQLFHLTLDPRYREVAEAVAPPSVSEPSWANWNWSANHALHTLMDDPEAGRRLWTETQHYVRHAQTKGAPWSIPTRYVWASLHRWIEAAVASRLATRTLRPSPERDRLFEDQLDYVFGRNNWGVSFLFTRELPNTVENIYAPAFRLLDLYPTGALSEGPGDRATHDRLRSYFRLPETSPLERFNTPAAVFYDHASDFMCQETTIVGQADAVLLLTLASLPR